MCQACLAAWASTKDARWARALELMGAAVLACQRSCPIQFGSDYLGTFAPTFREMIALPDIEAVNGCRVQVCAGAR